MNGPVSTQMRKNWRKQKLAQRRAIPDDERAAKDARVEVLLEKLLSQVKPKVLGFYWPIQKEFDAFPLAQRLMARGVRVALPVVVKKDTPLEWREWTPDAQMEKVSYGIQNPVGTAVLTPDAVLSPLVGFDDHGYRLGYGSGYYDRTLASLAPRPVVIGVGLEFMRLPTIFPEWHDIPMDYIATEAGLFQRTGTQLLPKIPGSMQQEELLSLLNTLLECERAGAAVLREYIKDFEHDAHARQILDASRHDEGRYCKMLYDQVKALGAEPSLKTGDFQQKALALEGNVVRLAFLNRGQAWVARAIGQALPRIEDAALRQELAEMMETHHANIRICDALIHELQA
jgi:5-formyltetrahydrofolate cyclo-ligase